MTTCILELQSQIIRLEERILSLEEESVILQLQYDLQKDFLDAAFDL